MSIMNEMVNYAMENVNCDDIKEDNVMNGMRSFYCVGLFVEKYLGYRVEGSNCNFEYIPETRDRFHMYLVDTITKERFDVTLWTTEGECGSGWCTASYGYINVTPVENKHPLTHCYSEDDGIIMVNEQRFNSLLPNYSGDPVEFEVLEFLNSSYVVVASVNYNGGDDYYPQGYGYVNSDYFKELKRGVMCSNRPVFLFTGDSASCKSSLASMINNEECDGEFKKVFETDSVNNLPDIIKADIIVMGHRNEWSEADIISRIADKENAKIIRVNFEVIDAE